MNNKKRGTEFEQDFCKLLKRCGYWVHFMNPSASGSQPCDIIACRDNIPYLIDCKTSAKKVFHINRLEENQRLAFYVFQRAGNHNCWVAVKYREQVYMINYGILDREKKVVLTHGFLFEEQGFH